MKNLRDIFANMANTNGIEHARCLKAIKACMMKIVTSRLAHSWLIHLSANEDAKRFT